MLKETLFSLCAVIIMNWTAAAASRFSSNPSEEPPLSTYPSPLLKEGGYGRRGCSDNGVTYINRGIGTIGLEQRDFLTEGIGQQLGHDLGTIDIVMGVVLLALRLGGLGTREEPHMEFLRALAPQPLLQVVRNLVSIDEMAVHAAGNVAGSHAIEAVGIDQRVALYLPGTVSKSCISQHFIVSHGRGLHQEVASHDGIHQHGDATMLTGLTNILRQIVVEGGAGIGVAVGLGLFIVVSELDDDVVARLDLLQDLVPAAFIHETLGGTAIHGMIVDDNDIFIEVALQGHAPPTLQFTFGEVLVGSGGIADDEDGRGLVWSRSREQNQSDRDTGESE